MEWADPYEGLNEAQKKVVAWDKGNVIVCAVPGSGKTRSVVNRLYRMSRDGADMSRTLATTFTRRGAGEMNDRLGALGCAVGRDEGIRVGTFHSVCLQIIRDGSPWADFEIDDTERMHYTLKDILGYRQMDWRGADITQVERFIGACKNGLVEPDGVTVDRSARSFDAKRPGVTNDRRFGEAYCMYEDERLRRGLLTFDDMLKSAVDYLRGDPDAAGRWAGRYDHVIVDEFQDTNLAQYELMKLLAAGAKSLMCVGDLDQLIFAWRGSVPSLTLTFQERFDAEVIRMETNYRSLPGILEHANHVVVHNTERLEQRSVPHREGKADVAFRSVPDMDAEAQVVVERIMELHEDGLRWGDNAVMFRTNAQSRAFEEECIRRKIPHIVIGGTSFYRRKEVADILAYLRLAADETDDKSCKRAINRPFRYIGRASLEKMEERAGKQTSMLDVARGVVLGSVEVGLHRRQRESLREFCAAVDHLKEDLVAAREKRGDLPAALSNLVKRIRYEEWIVGDEGTDTAENSRLSNIRELIRTSGRFGSAEKMLEYIDVLEDERQRRKNGESSDLVQLSTVHKQKGLEFPAVFVAGCAEGILPHGRSDDIEEERRIFFVAITRAKDHLMVTCPTGALIGGRMVEMEPSRFVSEAGLKDFADIMREVSPEWVGGKKQGGSCSFCGAPLVENEGGKGWRCSADEGHPTRIR